MSGTIHPELNHWLDTVIQGLRCSSERSTVHPVVLCDQGKHGENNLPVYVARGLDEKKY